MKTVKVWILIADIINDDLDRSAIWLLIEIKLRLKKNRGCMTQQEITLFDFLSLAVP